MNYAEIKYCDVANGPGVRTSLFVSGCSHHCPGCFNEIAWDFNYGKPFTQDTIDSIIESLKPDYIQGLTLLGGEPFEYSNQKGLLPLVRWKETNELLSYIDVLVDGRFVEELKNLNLKFKGSENQRTILVNESLKSGNVILYDFDK